MRKTKGRSHSVFVFILPFILVAAGCEKFDDIILNVKVIDGYRNTELENIEVSVVQRKPKRFWGYEVVSTYSIRTDSNGEGGIRIEEYNPEKYEYLVEANIWHEGPNPDLGGYSYFQYHGLSLEHYNLSEVVTIRLSKVP